MSIIVVANIDPELIELTDKRDLIQHNLFGGYLPWCAFLTRTLTTLF